MFCGIEVPKELFKNCVRVPVYCVNIYAQIFEGCNFPAFCSQLAIHKIFIFKISLARLWLASTREQDTHEWICLQ